MSFIFIVFFNTKSSCPKTKIFSGSLIVLERAHTRLDYPTTFNCPGYGLNKKEPKGGQRAGTPESRVFQRGRVSGPR